MHSLTTVNKSSCHQIIEAVLQSWKVQTSVDTKGGVQHNKQHTKQQANNPATKHHQQQQQHQQQQSLTISKAVLRITTKNTKFESKNTHVLNITKDILLK